MPGRPVRPTTVPVGRGPKVRAAVLAATLAELTEVGYAGLSMDGVAQRSGVHKTTVYRRWKDREDLVRNAVAEQVADTLPLSGTGDVNADLRRFARALVEWLNSPLGRAVSAVLSTDAARLPRVAEAKRAFFARRLAQARPLVRAAIEHGRLPADTDADELVKATVAPLYLRLLVTAEPIDDAVADSAAAAALLAARAGLLPARQTPSAEP